MGKDGFVKIVKKIITKNMNHKRRNKSYSNKKEKKLLLGEWSRQNHKRTKKDYFLKQLFKKIKKVLIG